MQTHAGCLHDPVLRWKQGPHSMGWLVDTPRVRQHALQIRLLQTHAGCLFYSYYYVRFTTVVASEGCAYYYFTSQRDEGVVANSRECLSLLNDPCSRDGSLYTCVSKAEAPITTDHILSSGTFHTPPPRGTDRSSILGLNNPTQPGRTVHWGGGLSASLSHWSLIWRPASLHA